MLGKINRIVAIIIIGMGSMPSMSSSTHEYLGFKNISCRTHGAGANFTFKSIEEKVMRGFALNSQEKLLTIAIPNGKGRIDWSDVSNISYVKQNDNEGYVSISLKERTRLMSSEKFQFIGFGVMERSCWSVLLGIVGDEIQTIEKSLEER